MGRNGNVEIDWRSSLVRSPECRPRNWCADEHNKQRYECEVRETDDDSAAKFATVAHDRGELTNPKVAKNSCEDERPKGDI